MRILENLPAVGRAASNDDVSNAERLGLSDEAAAPIRWDPDADRLIVQDFVRGVLRLCQAKPGFALQEFDERDLQETLAPPSIVNSVYSGDSDASWLWLIAAGSHTSGLCDIRYSSQSKRASTRHRRA